MGATTYSDTYGDETSVVRIFVWTAAGPHDVEIVDDTALRLASYSGRWTASGLSGQRVTGRYGGTGWKRLERPALPVRGRRDCHSMATLALSVT